MSQTFTLRQSNGKRDFDSVVDIDKAASEACSNGVYEDHDEAREELELFWRIGQTLSLDDIGSEIIPINDNPEDPPKRETTRLYTWQAEQVKIIQRDYRNRKRYELTLVPQPEDHEDDADTVKLFHEPHLFEDAQPIDHYRMDDRDMFIQWRNEAWHLEDDAPNSPGPTTLTIIEEDFGA